MAENVLQIEGTPASKIRSKSNLGGLGACFPGKIWIFWLSESASPATLRLLFYCVTRHTEKYTCLKNEGGGLAPLLHSWGVVGLDLPPIPLFLHPFNRMEIVIQLHAYTPKSYVTFCNVHVNLLSRILCPLAPERERSWHSFPTCLVAFQLKISRTV